jgi:DNA mismatch endonuclease (patch repair protein)
MVDVVDAATRSRMMSGIRGRNTKPEILVRSLLHREGFRFRLHVSDLPGRPDVVLPKYKAVIFIHGCFWHGHDCPLFKLPATRPDFWSEKIRRNQQNDQHAIDTLLADRWRVAVIWECALKGANRDLDGLVKGLGSWLRSDVAFGEFRR